MIMVLVMLKPGWTDEADVLGHGGSGARGWVPSYTIRELDGYHGSSECVIEDLCCCLPPSSPLNVPLCRDREPRFPEKSNEGFHYVIAGTAGIPALHFIGSAPERFQSNF